MIGVEFDVQFNPDAYNEDVRPAECEVDGLTSLFCHFVKVTFEKFVCWW